MYQHMHVYLLLVRTNCQGIHRSSMAFELVQQSRRVSCFVAVTCAITTTVIG